MIELWKKSYVKPRQHIKKQRHHFADKGLYSQRYFIFLVIAVMKLKDACSSEEKL